jgi:hypothetical protein
MGHGPFIIPATFDQVFVDAGSWVMTIYLVDRLTWPQEASPQFLVANLNSADGLGVVRGKLPRQCVRKAEPMDSGTWCLPHPGPRGRRRRLAHTERSSRRVGGRGCWLCLRWRLWRGHLQHCHPPARVVPASGVL